MVVEEEYRQGILLNQTNESLLKGKAHTIDIILIISSTQQVLILNFVSFCTKQAALTGVQLY
jgi:hypothetical protein